ncbi:MAG: hypothetical protein JNK05_38175 [Myxococcales bacterium]|nr:hypothetical protein [Myxococcales bacterium]
MRAKKLWTLGTGSGGLRYATGAWISPDETHIWTSHHRPYLCETRLPSFEDRWTAIGREDEQVQLTHFMRGDTPVLFASIAGPRDRRLERWDLSQQDARPKRLSIDKSSPWTCVESPDGKHLCVVYAKRSKAPIYDFDGELVGEFKGVSTEDQHALVDGERLAVLRDSQLTVIDRNGRATFARTLPGVYASSLVAVSATQLTVVIAESRWSTAPKLALVDIERNTVETLDEFSGSVTNVRVGEFANELVVACHDKRRLYAFGAAGVERAEFPADVPLALGRTKYVAVSEYQRSVGSRDGQGPRLTPVDRPAHIVRFLRDDTLATISEDPALRFWNLVDGTCLGELVLPAAEDVSIVGVCEGGSTLALQHRSLFAPASLRAYGCDARGVFVRWSFELEDGDDAAFCAVSEDGGLVATCPGDHGSSAGGVTVRSRVGPSSSTRIAETFQRCVAARFTDSIFEFALESHGWHRANIAEASIGAAVVVVSSLERPQLFHRTGLVAGSWTDSGRAWLSFHREGLRPKTINISTSKRNEDELRVVCAERAERFVLVRDARSHSSSRGLVRVCDFAGSTLIEFAPLDAWDVVVSVALSPDGSRLAVASGRGEVHVYALDA